MEKNKTNIDAVKVLLLGPFLVDETHAVHSYLIQKKNVNALIDIAPIQKIDEMIASILKHTTFEKLTHLIIQNVMLSTIDVLSVMIEKGFNGMIVTNKYIARQIENAKLSVDVITIDSMNDQLTHDNVIIFEFITMQFLPFPEMFMTFEPINHMLFSNLLMSSYFSGEANISLSDLQKQIFLFQKEMMPSSNFIHPILKKLDNYKPKLILPSYGYYIDSTMTPSILSYMRKVDFHNSFINNSKSGNANEMVNYIELINQLLLTLIKNFSRIEILNTFVGSPFHLESETLLLKKTTLVNYKLWHQFFEHIYVKKGMTWLTVLEPVMQYLMETYQLELPSIYRTQTMKLQEETRILEETRSSLESHLNELKMQINEAKDEIVKDPLTKLYVQDMLRQMMSEHFIKSVESGKTRGLMLIQLDQLPDINRRYTKETGDESVRNMAYVISQAKADDVMLFKQSGPGIYALIEDDTKEKIIKEAIKFRNAIATSNNFIEKVSISIAVVTCLEVDPTLTMEEKMKYLFMTLEKRMAYAKVKGFGEIIDDTYELPKPIEGSILLVDQDEVNRNMLYRIFKRIDYDVLLADSVIEAYELLEKRKIDVVISEINLSKMDGFQLKMKMNESKMYSKIPFIMVSHNKTVDNIRRGNLLDVDLILEKPIVPEELIGHVKRMKERVKS